MCVLRTLTFLNSYMLKFGLLIGLYIYFVLYILLRTYKKLLRALRPTISMLNFQHWSRDSLTNVAKDDPKVSFLLMINVFLIKYICIQIPFRFIYSYICNFIICLLGDFRLKVQVSDFKLNDDVLISKSII
ncbi:hypothetical protein C2G38_2117768 [Gigaspora rosea]|uniref:Uncharacterized protein n=1 Tax=Gigaspora rosea TaxID=44941 RepID=A0A397U602_9GLOM|nr:hypothetical protein C2G38_2117768 [Gigaspora rosea]